MPPPDRRPSRVRARVATVSASAVVLAVLLVGWWPHPVDAPLRGGLADLLQRLRDAGVPPGLAEYSVVEALANVALFVPVGVVFAAVTASSPPWIPAAIGALLSTLVEVVQLVARPERVATGADVLANVVGTLAGALLVAEARALAVRRRSAPGAPARVP